MTALALVNGLVHSDPTTRDGKIVVMLLDPPAGQIWHVTAPERGTVGFELGLVSQGDVIAVTGEILVTPKIKDGQAIAQLWLRCLHVTSIAEDDTIEPPF